MAVSAVRRRPLPMKGGTAFFRSVRRPPWIGGAATTTQSAVKFTYPNTVQGTQYTESLNHPQWKRGIPSSGDIGGPFYTRKQYVAKKPPSQTFTGSNRDSSGWVTVTTVTSPVLPCAPSLMQFPASLEMSLDNLEEVGASMVAECKPTNSLADLSTFLGEIYKDGIPKLMGFQALKSKGPPPAKAAGEYLNYEFGIKPILNDVSKFAHAVQNADIALRQYERDAGKVVRRRLEWPPEETETVDVIRSGVSPYVFGTTGGGMYDYTALNQGRVLRVSKTFQRRWFSGAFTYHLPTGYNSRNEMDRAALMARKIFGLELTPEVVWNLSPWSWAADWFTNAGDVISNLTDWATDGLVLRYGYVMEHTIASNTYTFVGPTGFSNPGVRPTPVTLVTETKRRVKANPFGFGITWGGLSPRQLAITAALGITNALK